MIARSAAVITRFSCPHIQKRPIVTYLKDVLRSGSLTPNNPLLDVVQRKDTSMAHIQPHHVAPAVSKLWQEYGEKLSLLKSDNLKALVGDIHDAQSPLKGLRQVCSFLYLVSDASEKRKWQNALAQLQEIEIDQRTFGLLEVAAKEAQSGGDETFVAQRLMREYQQRTGCNTSNPEEYRSYTEALGEIESDYFHTSSGSNAPRAQLLGAMYNYIGIRHRLAEMLGYDSYADQVLETRAATTKEIEKVHSEVIDGVLPLFETSEAESIRRQMDSYFSPRTGTSSPNRPKNDADRPVAMKLEEHVTMDGALFLLQRLSEDLFGIMMTEMNDFDAWHTDVRCFQCTDESEKLMGLFLIDPFERTGKWPQPVCSALLPRNGNDIPVVALSLSIDPPTWDTEAGALSWDDAEALFHEAGHVFQILHSSQSNASAELMPFDMTELLPKFMEHWLFEKPTILTMIGASKGPGMITDEESLESSIDEAFKQRKRQKLLKLTQACFYGSLELHLLSEFELQGNEMLPTVQERLVQAIVPHDKPDKKDLNPLLAVFHENAQGRLLAWYRYLYCDAVSAQLFERWKSLYSTDPTSAEETRQALRTYLQAPHTTKMPQEAAGIEISAEDLLTRYGAYKRE